MESELNKSMPRRERVLEAIRHHETDIVPYQIDLTSAAYTQLMGLVKDPEYLQRMGNHIVQGAYDMFVGETAPGSGFWRDNFGVVWNRTSIDTDIGFVEGIVLHEPSLSGFHAELNETRLRQGLEQALAAVEDECRVVDVGWGLFERGWTLRGMENLLVDMIAEPKFVDQLFERLCDHQMRVIDIALEYPFDLVLFGDDWGGQTGLILGKKHWQRYLKPHFARMFEKVKSAGKFIALHSCGNIEALFPDLINIGLDVYQTFQPEIYDIQAVKRKYGKALAFWGGISTQRVLPFGTSEDVKRVTRETIKILGMDGGYIIGPTHAIPGDTPSENIVALFASLTDAWRFAGLTELRGNLLGTKLMNLGEKSIMKKNKKIVLIGAGSAMFTRGLVADLILSDLRPLELGLVDIDPQALETAEKLSKHMVEARNAEIALQASTDRCDILPGADVVVSTIGVGGRRAWEADVFIPRKYGVYQPVGDSVMPGGVSRSMRMIPALVDIAKDVKALCPDARFFNYGNPMTANCWAIRKATGVEVVGLCHGTFHVERQLASFIGAPPEEITSLFVGLNHLTFIFDFRWKGRNAWPLVKARLAEERGQPFDKESLGKLFPEMGAPTGSFKSADNPFSWSIFDAYGAYPAVNDRHVVEFFPERFPEGRYYGKTLGVDVFSIEDTIAWGDKIYADMRAQALGEKPLDEGIFERSAGEHEQLLDILRSIEGDERGLFAANLPNRGAVPNLPADAILELPAVATAGGLRPLQILDFPDRLATIITRKLTATSLTVEAALTGDQNLFVEALLADGAVTEPEIARKMVEELLETHRQYLPNFFHST